MKKRVSAALFAVLMLTAVFCGCIKDPNAGTDNSKKYGAAVDFEGVPHEVSVFFVNVGKADCAIVNIDGHTWLVDCGTEESFISTCAALELMGVSVIDGVILTHGHSDHVGGLVPIAQKYAVGKIVTSALLTDSAKIDSAADEIGVIVTTAKAGDEIAITDGVLFEAVAPETHNSDNDNDNSLVLMLRVNGRRFLFTGDMQAAEDNILVSSRRDISCDVLKTPNHGNPDAVSEVFAKAARPLISIISTDTTVDSDSANRQVMAKLAMSEIYITQQYPLGVLVTVSPRGEITLSFPERPAAAETAVEIAEASKEHQSFTVVNNGSAEADISGMFVCSTKGGEVFVFPKGTVIEAGGKLTVACKKSDIADGADFIWNRKKVWAENKTDYAVLCDAYGNELSRKLSE